MSDYGKPQRQAEAVPASWKTMPRRPDDDLHCRMTEFERERLQIDLDRVDYSPRQLEALFASLASRLGRAAASRLWWAAFGAIDAAET